MKTDQNTQPATALTAEQTGQVAGGAAAGALVRDGCPTCTSGVQGAFAALANAVNPAD